MGETKTLRDGKKEGNKIKIERRPTLSATSKDATPCTSFSRANSLQASGAQNHRVRNAGEKLGHLRRGASQVTSESRVAGYGLLLGYPFGASNKGFASGVFSWGQATKGKTSTLQVVVNGDVCTASWSRARRCKGTSRCFHETDGLQ